MFSQNGLSLDQAPPISVVFRFFALGAFFGLLGGGLILYYQSDIFDVASPAALTLTHTFTLGIMLSFMFAALFQMLPVIAGVKLTAPVSAANLLLYPFVTGVFLLLAAFNMLQQSWLFVAASLLLVPSLLWITLLMLSKLVKLRDHSSSSKGMLIALTALGIVIILALYMTLSLAGYLEGGYYPEVRTAHYSLGFFGWIALLIISISFQVIEMFYVTPPYPRLVSRYLPLTLFGLLFVTTVAAFWVPRLWILSHILTALLLGGYAVLTLRRLGQRKRPLADATVWFWRFGLSMLLLAMATLVIYELTEIRFFGNLAAIFYPAFALSIVFAMFYKIVPFLTWFHLNSQGYFTAPMMHEVIHPKTAMKHLYIHLTTVVTFLLALFFAPLLFVAGLLTILSFGWMLWQIVHAWRLYRHTQKTGEKFEMNIA